MKQIAAKRRRAPASNGPAPNGPIPSGNAAPGTASGHQAPRPGPVRPRGSIIAAIDIGTTKICCFVARVENEPRIMGVGQQIARGVRGGTIIDLEAVGASISGAVHAAEEMAGQRIDRAVVNLSGGFRASRTVRTGIAIGRREIGEADMRQVLERGYAMRDAPDRQVIHSIPVGFSIDDSRGIVDPRGMAGERLGVEMHIVTAATAAVRNHTAAVGRAHLEAEALVASPYAAGLACLVEDEKDLGVTIIDMGGGTTTIGVFFGGNLIFADAVPVGGVHVTNDIARGLSTPLAHAERLKALFGSAVSSTLDEREMIAVPPIGEEQNSQVSQVPKSLLVGIIAPRLEETFELVRNRLDASGSDRFSGRRVVLTGGACQMHGARELAGHILDKQVRIGRPMRVKGLPETIQGPAFSTAAGLLHFAVSERAESPRPAHIARRGIFARVGHWMRENL
ncbi:MAG: cell division protein FtsA [Alphaproteobacteria bacterium]